MLFELFLSLLHQPIHADYNFDVYHRISAAKVAKKTFKEVRSSTYSLNLFIIFLVYCKFVYFSLYKLIPSALSSIKPKERLQLTQLKGFPKVTT